MVVGVVEALVVQILYMFDLAKKVETVMCLGQILCLSNMTPLGNPMVVD